MRWFRRPDYLLEDTFEGPAVAAGSVNGTKTSDATTTRTVTDTGSVLTITQGKLNMASVTGALDPQFNHPLAVTRVAGRVLVGRFTIGTVGDQAYLGFSYGSPPTGLDDFNYTGLRIRGTDIGVRYGADDFGPVLVANTIYDVAVVLRATGNLFFIRGGIYSTWTLLWIIPTQTITPYYPAVLVSIGTIANLAVDYIRIPRTLWLPQPLASDAFTRAALGSTDGAGHAETSGLGSGGDGKLWTGATFSISGNKAIDTPVAGATLVSDPGFAAAGDWAAGAGWTVAGNIATALLASSTLVNSAGTAPTANTWYQLSATGAQTAGSWTMGIGGTNSAAQTTGSYIRTLRAADATKATITGAAYSGTIDDFDVKPFTLSELFASVSLGEPDVLVSADLVVTAGTQAGVVINLDSAATPANFIIAYHDGTNAHLDKCVAGVYTSLVNAAAAYAASATIRVIKDGTSVSLYYNNAKVGTTQTVADAGIIGNTLHGLFSTYVSNTMDNFTVYARHHHKVPEE